MSRMPTTDGARRTRERVLNAALELFNERGSASVTTNHVAVHAGISPGNLYYWFSDKNEIVRELYGQFVAAYEQLWRADLGNAEGTHPGQRDTGQRDTGVRDRGQRDMGVRDTGNGKTEQPGGPLELTPDEVLARLAGGAALSRRYAFLARDLLGLLHADPLLAAEYRAVRQRRLAEFAALARVWQTQGVTRPLDDASAADLVEALWVIAETWLAFAELDGSHPDAEHGTRLLRVVLQPYLTPEGASGT